MADEGTDYYLSSDHADTVVMGEGDDAKYVPVAPGDVIQLSADDVSNEANAHLFEETDDTTAALLEVPPPEEQPTPTETQPAEPTPASEVTSKAAKGGTAAKK